MDVANHEKRKGQCSVILISAVCIVYTIVLHDGDTIVIKDYEWCIDIARVHCSHNIC